MKIELSVDELRELIGNEERETIDVLKYPRLQVDDSGRGSLVLSHPSCDGSLPLYELIQEGREWVARAICDRGITLKSSTVFEEAKDACTEHFMDACDEQAKQEQKRSANDVG